MPTKRFADAARCLAVLALAAGLAACASTPRTMAPRGKTIHIKLKDPWGAPYQIDEVKPDPKYICRGDYETDDCKKTVAWVLKGKELPKDWSVEVRLKQGATRKCFSKDIFKLAKMDTEEDSGEVNGAQCVRFDTWHYDVVLLDDTRAEQDKIDPLLIINY